MLKDLLETKKAFKLILGAGNQDLKQITDLVAVYAKAGCKFFDFAPDIDVLKAVQRGLDSVGVKRNEVYFCVSVGTSSDKHFQKAIIAPLRCIRCQKCKNVCPQSAIVLKDKHCAVIEEKCIGCERCYLVCPESAISFQKFDGNLSSVLEPLLEYGIDCIEFHIRGDEGDEIFDKWNQIQQSQCAMLSICIGHQYVSDERMISVLNKMMQSRLPKTTIIQADGIAMSGDLDSMESSLEAVKTAKTIQEANLSAYLMISGGVNDKSYELAKEYGLELNGIAMGSYARKIVKKYMSDTKLLSFKIESIIDLCQKFQ
ncbi:MAG: LdpA C-terminal domain-containing domain [Candidatus Gastranaerophilales bacterium]|nr:LdpA C-terminal domain-containing domain [Candidatus Gastranaerophilales bacterium]